MSCSVLVSPHKEVTLTYHLMVSSAEAKKLSLFSKALGALFSKAPLISLLLLRAASGYQVDTWMLSLSMDYVEQVLLSLGGTGFLQCSGHWSSTTSL